MRVSEFDYHLPEELIAQEPLADRDASRLLHLHRESGRLDDRGFGDFPDLLRAGDLVVFNNTRVFPGRLYGRRGGVQVSHVSQTRRDMGHPGNTVPARDMVLRSIAVVPWSIRFAALGR